MAGESIIKIKQNKKGVSIEFKNINMKPEELHKAIEDVRKGRLGSEDYR